MKTRFAEYDGFFSIELEAETLAEAATITRFGIDAKTEVRTRFAHAGKTGDFSLNLVFGKRRRPDGVVIKGR